MKAVIRLDGPVPYGVGMWELHAVVKTESGEHHTLKWSVHHAKDDAEEYQARFNSYGGEPNEQ
jgi:hypothetical protein